jgi:hypothetical protein
MGPIKPTLEFVFRIRLQLGIRQKLGPLPQGGLRGFVAAAGGTIDGPRLKGRVVPNSGGDWALYRPDDAVAFDARYMLEADDGALIYMQNRGYRHAPPETAARMEALDPVDPSMYYMRLAPTFETPAGKHAWLMRTIIVGSAARQADHSIFDYYAVL